jgi:sulfur transfer complex TusBCD TusB component (DsrH family)
MKVLQIVDSAYRTLVEEQDDTILWLTQSMHSAGAELSVLLTGNAAYYAVQKQRQPTLQIGDWIQQEPADLLRDLDSMLQKGIHVYVIREELSARGLADVPAHPGVKVINKTLVPELYEQADQVWRW